MKMRQYIFVIQDSKGFLSWFRTGFHKFSDGFCFMPRAVGKSSRQNHSTHCGLETVSSEN